MTRSAANVVLCVLTLVGSTSLTVRHAHARGGVPHAHGLGPAVGPHGGPGGDGRHEHLLLCGVELYHPDEPTGDAPTGPEPAPAELTVGLGDACDHRGDGAADAAGGELFVGLVPAGVPATVPARARTVPTSAPPVCDSARGARTGVLLV